VGVKNIVQINNPHDPVANGWVNGDGDYEVTYNLGQDISYGIWPIPILDNLQEYHPFKSYYNKNLKRLIRKEAVK
jgi:hypothetical protein